MNQDDVGNDVDNDANDDADNHALAISFMTFKALPKGHLGYLMVTQGLLKLHKVPKGLCKGCLG